VKTLTVAPLTQRWPVVLASLALSVSCVAAVSQSPSDRITGLEVDGTVFRIRLASGNVLTGRDLAGATLTLTQPGDAGPRRVRVESVETDPLDSDHEVLLYHLLSVDDPGREPVELCGPDMRGERWAFPIRGQWDAEGNHVSDAGYTLTCGDGAQGKCVRFGYKPWKTTAAGVSLSAFYQACIRLVRADYCGGHGTTRDGMLIDIFDRIGIQTPDPQSAAAGVRFEAAWNEAGAVCVAHTRVPEKVSLEQLATECPRLRGRLGEAACTEDRAGQFGDTVLLYVRSR